MRPTVLALKRSLAYVKVWAIRFSQEATVVGFTRRRLAVSACDQPRAALSSRIAIRSINR